jgi:hypothetical protein
MGDSMKSTARFFLLLTLIFINFNCNKKANPTKEKPGAVTLIPGVEDTSRIEKGIDAIPDGDLIRIEWTEGDASTVFYEVFRGSAPNGAFSKIVTLEIPVRFFEDQVPAPYVRYYYFIRALNDEGVESDPSDTLSYRLIRKAEGLDPVGTCGSRPVFRWLDPNHANFYIIRVEKMDSGNLVWLSRFQSPQFGSEEQLIAYNADHSASQDSLSTGTQYRWRIDIVGNERNSGSESSWTPIQIQ